MVTRVFPRFKQFARFYFEFSCVRGDIFHEHCCDYFAFGFYIAQSKKDNFFSEYVMERGSLWKLDIFLLSSI